MHYYYLFTNAFRIIKTSLYTVEKLIVTFLQH